MTNWSFRRRSRSELTWVAVLFVASLLLFSFGWRHGMAGGVAEVGALRVLAGEQPYRDFWTMYAPGQFYLLAALLGVFGKQWIISPIASSVIFAMACSVSFVVARRAGASRAAAAAAGAVLALAIATTPYYRTCGSLPPALLFILLAWAFAVGPRSIRSSVLAGAALGVAALFKHDVAGYSAAGVALLLGLGRGWWLSIMAGATAFVVFLAGIAPHLGPQALESLVLFPLGDFPSSRPEVFPLFPWKLFDGSSSTYAMAMDLGRSGAFWLPVLLFGISSKLLFNRPEERRLVVALFATFCLHALAARVQVNTHIISWTMLSVLAVAPALGIVGRRSLEAGVSTLIMLLMVHAATATLKKSVMLDRHAKPARIATAHGMLFMADEAHSFERLSRLVEQHVSHGRIYVGERRHDAVFTGPTPLYFLLDRLPPVRHHELHPAVTDTRLVQQAMIDDLMEHDVRLVVLRDGLPDDVLDQWRDHLSKEVPAVGSRLLDDFLNERFEPLERVGGYEVRIRRADRYKR